MMRKFLKGFRLGSNADALANEGEVKYNDTTKEIQYKDDAGTKTIINSDSFTGAGVSVGTDGNGKAQVTIVGGGGSADYDADFPTVYYKHEISKTAGPGSTSAGINTRPLTVVSGNETDVGSSLSSNQVTLPNGTYKIKGWGAFRASDQSSIYLYNVTDTSYDIEGQCSFFSSGSTIRGHLHLSGTITVTGGPKVFELRQYHGSGNSSGFGQTGLADMPGTNVTYAELEIQKIG